MWFLVFIHRDRASTSIFETRACWNKLVDQVLVRVLLPCSPQSTDSSPSLRQIQDARNHVNQALLLLGSHDESYRFKTGAEVNKVCATHRVRVRGGLRPHSSTPLRLNSSPVSLFPMQLMDAVMLQLTRARNRLTTPASMTLPELATSGLMVRGKKAVNYTLSTHAALSRVLSCQKRNLLVFEHSENVNNKKISSNSCSIERASLFDLVAI